MKVYTYDVMELSRVGLRVTVATPISMTGVCASSSPDDADVFVSPTPLSDLPDRATMALLPHFERHEARHVFMDISDCQHEYGTTALLVRCNLTTRLRASDPHSIAWPWPASDLGEDGGTLAPPLGGLRFDATFRGRVTTGLTALRTSVARGEAVLACRNALGERFDCAAYDEFHGRSKEGERELRQHNYADALRASRLALCPESTVGAVPYRFYEALSAGRPPVLFSSGAVLPWDGTIPWHEIAFIYPADLARSAGAIITEIVQRYSDDELLERGRLGRQWWDRLLAPARWGELLTQVVARDFASRGLL